MRVVALFLVVLIALFGSVLSAFETECKRPNEEFSNCAANCEPKCNKYPGEKCSVAELSIKMCTIGCTCKDGHARIADDKCVPVDSDECGGKHDPWDGIL